MHQKLWTQHITTESCPKWPCSICHNGYVFLDDGSLQFKETATSQSYQDHPEWEPEWVEYCFTAWATCSNRECNQHYVISGSGTNVVFYDEYSNEEVMQVFSPMFCYPMPDIIHIPEQCPEEVCKPLRESFSIYYADKNSCAGKIRCALEKLMDHVGVPSRERNKRLSLHARLENYQSSKPQIAHNLMAIKWLGNNAIHETAAISNDDILAAYEIIEHTVEKIFVNRTERIREMAQSLKDKHEPQR